MITLIIIVGMISLMLLLAFALTSRINDTFDQPIGKLDARHFPPPSDTLQP